MTREIGNMIAPIEYLIISLLSIRNYWLVWAHVSSMIPFPVVYTDVNRRADNGELY